MHLVKKSLKQQAETRWNSMLTLLFSISSQLTQIDAIMAQNNQLDRMMEIDRDTLQELTEFLTPFNDISEKFEGSSYPTLQIILPRFLSLETHCSAKEGDSVNLVALKEIVSGEVKGILKPTDFHKIAATLNPRMKNLKFLEEAEKQRIYGKIREWVTKTTPQQLPNPPVAPEAAQTPTPAKAPRFAAYEDTDSEDEEVVQKDEVKVYLEMKIKKDISILQFWKENAEQLPCLAKIAQKILAVPGSSAPSERNFSVAGNTLEKRRTQLNPSTVDDILFLNSNLKLNRV